MKVLDRLLSCLDSHTSPTQLRTLMAPLVAISDGVCENDTTAAPTLAPTTTVAPSPPSNTPPYQCYSCQRLDILPITCISHYLNDIGPILDDRLKEKITKP